MAQDERYGPIVDYNPTAPADRQVYSGRGGRYNTRHPLPMEIQQNLYRDTINCGGGVAPPLVQWSDYILIGHVVGAQARLSTDLSNVYSTYTFQVEAEVKNHGTSSVNLGGIVEVDREGGRVRYPSGYVLHFSIDGNGMPQVGKRYVFFLKWDETEQSYLLVTGYGLEEGKVIRLDKAARNIAYEGPDVDIFIQKLEEEVKLRARPNNSFNPTPR